MSVMKTGDRPVTIDGIRVGTSVAIMVRQGREIRIDLRFRPYWPGMFHLMARLADKAA